MVTRDSEVVQMPLQHLLHPSSGLRDGVMHTFAQLQLDRLELGSHILRVVFCYAARAPSGLASSPGNGLLPL
jgi:hypothetical protein